MRGSAGGGGGGGALPGLWSAGSAQTYRIKHTAHTAHTHNAYVHDITHCYGAEMFHIQSHIFSYISNLWGIYCMYLLLLEQTLAVCCSLRLVSLYFYCDALHFIIEHITHLT